MSTSVVITITITLLVVLSAGWASIRFGSWRHFGIGVAGTVGSLAVGVWLYTKRPEPEPAACFLPAKAPELGSICGFKNPEDLQHIPSMGLVLVSEEGFGGRLLSLRLDRLGEGPLVLWPPDPASLARMGAQGGDLGDVTCPFPADPSALWPHGLTALEPATPQDPVRVAFVSHRLMNGVLTDSIQLFDLHADGVASLQWRGCINFPDDATGNDIAYLSDGSLVATNFAPRGTLADLQRSVRRGGLGFDTGDIIHWSGERGWSHMPNTRGALPNGIAVSPDEKAIYFADAGNSRIVIVPLGPGGEIARVHVGGAPNNLTVTRNGRILATSATLSGELPIICGLAGRQCRSGWTVWEIDPTTRTVVEVVSEEGRYIASATTALEVDNMLFIGSMADTRVGVYRRR